MQSMLSPGGGTPHLQSREEGTLFKARPSNDQPFGRFECNVATGRDHVAGDTSEPRSGGTRLLTKSRPLTCLHETRLGHAHLSSGRLTLTQSLRTSSQSRQPYLLFSSYHHNELKPIHDASAIFSPSIAAQS